MQEAEVFLTCNMTFSTNKLLIEECVLLQERLLQNKPFLPQEE